MSVVSALLAMTQRVTVERDANAGNNDAWGNPAAPDWQPHLPGLQCRVWTQAGREAVANSTTPVVVEDLRMIVPLGTDVTERDRLGDVTDTLGNVLVAGPTGIRAVMYERDYLELVLVRLS